MPSVELYPISTAIAVAGWADPTNVYTNNNAYATTSTTTAEQSYDFPKFLEGAETLDRVFVRIKWYSLLTTVLGGDNSTAILTIRVYDGSTWTNYQVSSLVYNCTTTNGESFTSKEGDNNSLPAAIDVSATLDTTEKLNSAQVALLATITVEAGVTPTLAVDSVSILACYHMKGDVFIGAAKTKRDLDTKENRAFQWVKEYLKVTS